MTDKAKEEMAKELDITYTGAEEILAYIHKKGWIKPTKDSVVLTMEEVYEFRKDQAEVKFLKKQITDQARKETAREILKEILRTPIKLSYGLDERTVNIMTATLIDKVNELAKQYGVEIGEEV